MQDLGDQADPIDAIRRAIRAYPFHPMSVTTTRGRVFSVCSSESISVSPDGLEVIICEDNRIHRLDASDIVGAYPMRDVATFSLVQAQQQGWTRGCLVGLMAGLVAGFFLGVMVTVLAWSFRFPRL